MVKPLPILLGNAPGKCIRVNMVMDKNHSITLRDLFWQIQQVKIKVSCSTEILVTILSVWWSSKIMSHDVVKKMT
jgi:hypothetical protein